MVDYPINYKKPSLAEYLADYIVETGHANDWERLDLGELVARDIAEANLDYKLNDVEEVMLSAALERFIELSLGDAISAKIAEQVESAKDWRDAEDSAINNN